MYYKFKVGDIVSFTIEEILDSITMTTREYNRKYGLNLTENMINSGRKLNSHEISNTAKIVETRTYSDKKIYRVDIDGCDAFYYTEDSLIFPTMNIFDEEFII